MVETDVNRTLPEIESLRVNLRLAENNKNFENFTSKNSHFENSDASTNNPIILKLVEISDNHP